MNSFVFNKDMTNDLNDNGQFPLFGFAYGDYICLLSDKKKNIPQSISAVGVILNTADNSSNIEDFIEFIKTTDTDIVVFGFSTSYRQMKLQYKLIKDCFNDSNYEELEDCYEDRAVFVIKPELRPSCDEVKSENIKEVIKDE